MTKSNAEIILLAVKAVIDNYNLDDDIKVEVVDCILDGFMRGEVNDAVSTD